MQYYTAYISSYAGTKRGIKWGSRKSDNGSNQNEYKTPYIASRAIASDSEALSGRYGTTMIPPLVLRFNTHSLLDLPVVNAEMQDINLANVRVCNDNDI